MKKVIFLLNLFLLLSCSGPSAEEQIQHLNGYWEIHTAELPEGITKEFRVNQLVDYIQVDEKEGFRTKVRPQFDGSFENSEVRENFEIKIENDSINLYYTTPYSKWKETIISSEEDQLKILNPKGIIYTYNRFTPYSQKDGEEN